MARLVLALLAALPLVCFAITPASLPTEHVSVPGGLRYPRECVREVPSGSQVALQDGGLRVTHPDGTTVTFPECKPIAQPAPVASRSNDDPYPYDYDGWLAYTTFATNNSGGFDSFLGTFSVPNAPATPPDVLYIFTGLQNVDWIPIVDPKPDVFDIIQPVLQYPGDNGNYWSIKSWYVTLNVGALYSTEVKVAVGDIIFGNMTRTGTASWYIDSVIQGTTQHTALTCTNAERLYSQPWAYTTVECYGCPSCAYLPNNALYFQKMALVEAGGRTVSPVWAQHYSPNRKCHETSVVNSPADVTYTFQ